MPLPAGVQYKVATDPEATQSSISLIEKRARERQDRVGDYRRNLVSQLVYQMLNDRFDELSRKPDAPFLNAGVGGSGSRRPSKPCRSGHGAGRQIEAGLAALAIEASASPSIGFGPGELERAKKWTLAGYDRAFTERDKTESGSLRLRSTSTTSSRASRARASPTSISSRTRRFRR